MTLIWDDAFLLHLPVIDAQHRQLFTTLSELEAAMAAGISAAETEALLVRLQHYAARHFSIEEKYMAQSHYPGLKKHRQAHQEFATTFARMLADCRTGNVAEPLAARIERQLSQWLKDHVTGLDQTFGVFYAHYLQELKDADNSP